MYSQEIITKEENAINLKHKKKYILFDNDGVLVETEHLYYRANVEILKSMGVEIQESRYRDIMIKGQSAFLLAEEKGFDAVTVENYRDKRNELYQHYLKTEDISIMGVTEVLQELKQKYEMCVITSARREDFDLLHQNRGIVDHMSFVLCSGEYKRSKPHPDPYLEGMQRFNATKEECIVIEDSQRGLESAYSAGIECVVVHNEFTVTHDFTHASCKIKKFEDLLTLL